MLTVVNDDASIAGLADERDARGRRLVVRNGHHQPRKITTSAGPAGVRAPRVNGKRVDEATGARFERGLLVERAEAVAASATSSRRACNGHTAGNQWRSGARPRWKLLAGATKRATRAIPSTANC